MHYDLGYFDDETCRLEPIENPFAPKLLPDNSGMDPRTNTNGQRAIERLFTRSFNA